ncbi:MAG: NAD(P)H-dependent oxidoreductase [Leptospirales bacterium]|nr:NAD(P)H-dependent oxidoreductase [Leptospirales bacterium]
MIEIVSGTNRPDSKTIKLARIICQLYIDAGSEAQILDLVDLPPEIFLPSSYKKKPDGFLAMQQRILTSRGVHIVVPEYNGSFPGALKYFIDMLKFPECLEHRAVAFTGLADGLWGGIRAVEQLQMVFNYRNAYCLPERVWFPQIGKKLSADATAINDDFQYGLLKDQVKRFIAFSDRNSNEAATAIKG